MSEGLTLDLQEKLDRLKKYIGELGSLAIGFSGGVDSAFLLAVSHEVLGDGVIAVTEADASVPGRELDEAKAFCEERGIRHIMCTVDPFKEAEYRHNGPDRCYFCKKGIFSEIKRIAEENGISHVAEGSNMDDLGDYRPGMKAVAELGVLSPLREAGLTQQEIRVLSEKHGLPTWNKPSFACLASRFVYGETISPDKLRMVDMAEQYLLENGFPQFRVRIHGENLARIEVLPEDLPKLLALREETAAAFRRFGFLYVTMDLLGYRTGSMNEGIKGKKQDGYKGTAGKS